jgi:hypothetical protein
LPGTHLREPWGSFCTSALMRCRRIRDAPAGVVLHRWKPRVLRHSWLLLGFNQCRLHHACRACGTSRCIPSRLAAFLTCSFPLCLSTKGAVSCPRRFSGRVGGKRGSVSRPFPTAPLRTVLAPFNAHGSPVLQCLFMLLALPLAHHA